MILKPLLFIYLKFHVTDGQNRANLSGSNTCPLFSCDPARGSVVVCLKFILQSDQMPPSEAEMRRRLSIRSGDEIPPSGCSLHRVNQRHQEA